MTVAPSKLAAYLYLCEASMQSLFVMSAFLKLIMKVQLTCA